MSRRPKIKISVVERRGECACHRGHKVGDEWDFDKERGKICPLAMNTLFPMINILRYGGELPISKKGDSRFACPDCDVLNIFKIEKIED